MKMRDVLQRLDAREQERHENMLHAIDRVRAALADIDVPEAHAPWLGGGKYATLYFSVFDLQAAKRIIDALPASGFLKHVEESCTTFRCEVDDISIRISVYAELCDFKEVKLPRAQWTTTKKVVTGCRPLSATYRTEATPVSDGA